MSEYRVLAARLSNELKTLDRVVHAAQSQCSKAQKIGDPDFYQAAALSLQNYYMGAERIFEEVAKKVDLSLPTGAGTHRELLEQMGLEIPNTRPPLLSEETITQVNTYRAFRHVVIHRYGFELYPDRVAALVEQLAGCHVLLTRDVKAFCQFLLELDQSLSENL
ncbi:MAG: hypothetical protein VKL39_04115 [Leptolyngbyaceae bacterium]|nr:hypothetical protein [Leptolyngbyaceae bacterium]